MGSLSENVIWNSIRVGSNMLFPIITFPYVTRVLGPEQLGTYNYVYAIVSYFSLFSNLGFPLYGTREVARDRNKKEVLSDTISSIFSANVISTILVTILYTIFCIFFIQDELILYWLLGLSLVFNCISFDWFFQGIEDFKYITIRSLIFRVISICLLFILVKTKNDLLLYAGISIIATFGSNICNLYLVVNKIKLRFTLNNCLKHFKGAYTLFLGTIVVSLYTQINTVMIGALDTVIAVAFFTTANKLVQLALSIINAIQTSIMPRISFLVGNNNIQETATLQKSFLNLILYLTLPITFGMYLMANDLILIFGGIEFMPAAKALKILCFLVIIISLSGFMGFHVLYPHKKEKLGNYCTILGACTNLLLNFVLIKYYSYIGIAYSVLIAEIIVTISHYYFSRKYMNIRLKDFLPINALISTILMCLVISIIPNNNITGCIIKFLIGVFVYLGFLLCIRDSFATSTISTLYNKVKRNK